MSVHSRGRLPAWIVFIGVTTACAPASSLPPTDLLAALPQAERRAAGRLDEAVRVDFAGPPTEARPSLLMTAPARVTYRVRMPAATRFTTAVRLVEAASTRGVTVRVGLSSGRRYEELARLPLGAPHADGWTPVDVDLSAYSGRQWSLFYRPDRITWQLILNADAVPGGTVAWATPAITMR